MFNPLKQFPAENLITPEASLKPVFFTCHILFQNETFEKCSILLKAKEGENFNQKNTLSILRIKIFT
jgi:hypothetical protein